MHGEKLGRRWRPVERAGLYVPGGRAAYPSTVLMNAVPAKVAGVNEIVICSPAGPDGQVNPVVLAAAHLTGVRSVMRIGGAQAVAAMAFGTESVPKVDVISGPGNLYVTLAKQAVYGQVGIDSLAGPSEVLVIADQSAARLRWLLICWPRPSTTPWPLPFWSPPMRRWPRRSEQKSPFSSKVTPDGRSAKPRWATGDWWWSAMTWRPVHD